MAKLGSPSDISLPFFAYGLLRPGAPAHPVIEDLVDVAGTHDGMVVGQLHIRDGIPLLEPGVGRGVRGSLLQFRDGAANEAYKRISAFEPGEHYVWERVQVLTDPPLSAWALAGVHPRVGSVPSDDIAWHPGPDAAFSEAMEEIGHVIEEHGRTAFGADSSSELRRMFRLQMAYLLLWTIIERYGFLRHGLRKRIEERVEAVGADAGFRRALTAAAHGVSLPPIVFDKAMHGVMLLDPERHSLAYFREVRHHLVHRGKGMPDAERLRLSLLVLQKATASFLEVEGLR